MFYHISRCFSVNHVVILAHIRNVIDSVHVSSAFSHWKEIKSHFKGSYDQQNLTLVVIAYEIYETPGLQIRRSNKDNSEIIFLISQRNHTL